jgi:hypothetical protein
MRDIALIRFLLLAAVIVVAAICVSCGATHREGADDVSAKAIASYREGMAEAMREIRAGDPTIYTFGLNNPGGVDPQTGLRYQRVGGDAADPGMLWHVLGHNDAVKAYRGVPLGPAVP